MKKGIIGVAVASLAVSVLGVEIGDAASVLSTPKHSYTKRLISAVPSIDRRRQDYRIDNTDVPSLVRPPGYEPARAEWNSYGVDHMARVEQAQ